MHIEPEAIDTSTVELRTDLRHLAERLAVRAHENWVRRRIREGWTYGSSRNDIKRQHPCLVPFGDLSESEKLFEFDSAIDALKTIMALGYRVEKE